MKVLERVLEKRIRCQVSIDNNTNNIYLKSNIQCI